MKKNYFLILVLTFFISSFSFGQTTLSAGDLVVIEFRADTPDTFRFVPLVDLEAGTIIKFSEGGYSDTNSSINTNESIIVYTAPSAITAGTNVKFEADDITNNPSVWAFELGTFVGFSASGDNLLVYQGDTASPTFIFAVQSNSTEWQTNHVSDSNQSALPPGLTDGVNAVAAGAGAGAESEFDNIYYNGITSGSKSTILASVANASNWVGDNGTSYSPITGNFTISTSMTPNVTITSPSANQVFPSTTTEVPVTLSIDNFTVSGDAGGGVSDNSGDGYIKSTFETQGGSTENSNFFTTTLPNITVAAGNTYTLTLELVDNSGNSLSTPVTQSVTFSVLFPCDIQLATILTTCETSTSGTDTYTTSIDFTAGNTTTYTITAKDSNNNDVGTIGGDNPSTSASGTITITGVPEGTDFTVKVNGGTGSSCDLTRNISSPTCFPLPIFEDFSYADGSLTNNPLWNGFSGTSGDLLVESGQAVVQHGTPSEDAQIQFESVSGNIYYALDFTVVDPGNPIPGTDNEYFALFKDSGFGFVGRLDIVPPTSSGDFSVGIASDGSTADSVWATDLSYGVKYRATVKYDQLNDIAQLWIDATLETDTSILGADLEDPGRTVIAFALRQSDSDLNEKILVDNLKIGTTFSETTLSSSDIEIQGFAIYPNPVTNGRLSITSNSSDNKQVSIFNVLGKNVLNTIISGTKAEVNTSGISAGIYILKVVEGGKTATSKLIIR
jgi:hypothetical protein